MSYARSNSQHPAVRLSIPFLVVCLHAVLLWVLLWGRFMKMEPPTLPPGIDVSLVFAPPGEQPSPPDPLPSPPEDPAPQPPPEPEPPAPEPPAPEPPKPEPPKPIPVPEPPKPVPVPEPPKPIPVPEPPKPVPKPVPKPPEPAPVPRPEPPKPTPKPTPKPPEPPRSRVNSVDDIRKRNDFQPTPPRPAPVTVDRNRLADSLRQAAGGVQVNPTTSTRNAPAANPAREMDFQAALAATVQAQWREDFNASELTGTGRVAKVQFVIRSDGSVVSARIVSRSGVPAIDTRAERVVQTIKRFPAPSGYGITAPTYTVEFDLRAKD